MYSKILAPLDGSQLSECSLVHVKAMALAFHVPEVVLLLVVEPLPVNFSDDFARSKPTIGELDNKRGKEASSYLSHVVDKLKNEGILVKGEVAEGKPAEVIEEYSKNNKIDLVIMSSHGRSGISRWAYGSVAEKVVRQSTVPVLLVSAPGCRVAAAS